MFMGKSALILTMTVVKIFLLFQHSILLTFSIKVYCVDLPNI